MVGGQRHRGRWVVRPRARLRRPRLVGGISRLDASLERIDAFFVDDRDEAIAISVCHALSAVALMIFVAHLYGFVDRISGRDTRFATLALGAGVASSIFLLVSAVLYWTLTRSEVAEEPGVAQAVLVLSYLAGGLALAISLGGFIGATSVVTLRTGTLPRWIGRLGVATAGLSMLSVVWLIWDPAFSLLLLVAALGFFWLFATSVALLRTTQPRSKTAP